MSAGLSWSDENAVLRCGVTVRSARDGHDTLESAARLLARCFYDTLQATGPESAERACVLVRCYKTHPYGSLPPDLQRAAGRLLEPGELPTPAMRCASLLASVGDEPTWNSRHDAGPHAAIPLPTIAAVARWPLIARVARDFGLSPADLVDPSPGVVRTGRGRNFGISRVEEELDQALSPAEAVLARRHGVRSVVAFGCSLSTGDLFAVVLYCRVLVPREVAEQFRALALQVKAVLFGFGESAAFDPVA